MRRIQENSVKEKLQANKLIVLSGPKGVGKLDFLKNALHELHQEPLLFDCSDKKIAQTLANADLTVLKKEFGVRPFVLIHEAQYLDNLQEIIEYVLNEDLKNTLILACSFQPEIDPLLWEVIQMQNLEIKLPPYLFYELANHFGLPNEERSIEQRLIYGQYPEVVNNPENAKEILAEKINGLLKRQIGLRDRINKTDKMLRVLQFLSFKIGQPVSYNEVGTACEVDNETVERYVELLEKSHVLFKLPAFHSEKRYELKKTHVIYFQDCGIRNALIQNFNPLFLRQDVQELWKNWLISERMKWNQYMNKNINYAFWRTHTAQEIEFLEEIEGQISAYKTNWNKQKKVKIPALFQSYYPNIKTIVLNKSTYWTFLSKK